MVPDLLIDGKWFPRNERDTKYELTPKYFKRDNKGNNISNPFHIETRWKVDWTISLDGKHGNCQGNKNYCRK